MPEKDINNTSTNNITIQDYCKKLLWAMIEGTSRVEIGDIPLALKSAGPTKAFSELSNVIEEITKTTRTWNSSEVDENTKTELLKSYQEWGRYGWTVTSLIPQSVYKMFPTSVIYANKTALAYCEGDGLTKILIGLNHQDYLVKPTLEEAIYCFEHMKYTACCLTLLSIIDGQIISIQEPKPAGEGFRPPGIKGLKKIHSHFVNTNSYTTPLSWQMLEANLIACVEHFFEYGDDFKKQPVITNRNFISHGMLTRGVTRTDCIQLFLLCANVTRYLNVYRLIVEGDHRNAE